MSDVLKISVTNIGPHEGRSIEITEGVSLLAGPCGVGKTSFLNAVGASVGLDHRPTATYMRESPGPRLVGGKGRKPPTGQVLLPGVGGDAGATVSPSGRVSRFGVPAVDVVDGDNFAKLTRPGGTASTEAKRRLEGFSGLTGVKASVSDLVDPAFVGIPGLSGIPSGGLVDTAEAVRLALFAHRNKVKTGVLPYKENKVAALRAQFGEGPIDGALSPTVAGAYLSEAQTQYQRIVASAGARQQMEATQARLREGRGPRPDVEGSRASVSERIEVAFDCSARLSVHREAKPAPADVTRLEGVLASVAQRRHFQAQEINRLERELAEMKAAYATTVMELANAEQDLSEGRAAAIVLAAWEATRVRYEADATTANARLEDAQRADREVALAGQRWDDAEVELSRPIEGATAEDVEAAEVALDAARLNLSNAQENARREAVKADLDDEVAALEEVKTLIDSLEEAATAGVQTRMRKLLESSGAKGWAVVDGVVYATHPKHGDLVPVSSLSTGELDRLALGLLLSKQERKEGAYTLLLLDQDVGNCLDSATLTALGELAREHGVYILTGATRDLPELAVIHY